MIHKKLNEELAKIEKMLIDEVIDINAFNNFLNKVSKEIFRQCEEGKNHESIKTFNIILNQIISCMQNKDYVYLLDLVRYTLKDFLQFI